MYRHYRFDVTQNDDTGMVGLAMQGRQWAAPMSGMAAIHDILEHGANDDGSVEGEIMAMGASFLIRGEEYNHTARSFRTSPGYHWSGELVEQADRYMRAEQLRDPGRTCRITDHEEVEAWAQEACQEARKQWASEHDGPLPAWLSEAEQWRIIGWVRRGYRKAFDRYSRLGLTCYPGFLAQFYTDVQKAADKALTHGDEGMVIDIAVDLRRFDFRVESYFPKEY